MSKKSFIDNINPAMNFISQNKIDEYQKESEQSKSVNIDQYNAFQETKSKRLQLLIQPSLHEKLKVKANQEKTSVNDLVNQILKESVLKW